MKEGASVCSCSSASLEGWLCSQRLLSSRALSQTQPGPVGLDWAKAHLAQLNKLPLILRTFHTFHSVREGRLHLQLPSLYLCTKSEASTSR